MMRAAVCLLLLGACTSTRAPGPGRISVELYEGMGGKASGTFLPAVELIVDATHSMSAREVGRVSRLDAARAKATELLQSLPAGTQAALHTLGAAPDAECSALEQRVPRVAAGDASLTQALRELAPAGEGSLARAVADLAAGLQQSGRARDSRLVLITDLDPSCGGDLCAAVENLVAGGAWLDVVVLGGAPAPACLSGLLPSSEQPGALVRAMTRPAPAWSLLPLGGAPGTRALTGTAGPQAIEAPAGDWFVLFELERPLSFGPVPVASGSLTRVRVLNFPGGAPRFVWETIDER
jgi:hypothetical protein